jgi:hypothetical protein
VRRPRVRNAQWADGRRAAEILAQCLHVTPLGLWLVPSGTDQERQSALAAGLLGTVGQALTFGAVHMLDDGSGGAVWLRRFRSLPAPANLREELAIACGDRAARFAEHFRLLDAGMPEHPHTSWLLELPQGDIALDAAPTCSPTTTRWTEPW